MKSKGIEVETYKWYFEFAKPVNCFGYDIYEDQCFADTIEKAREIMSKSYFSLINCHESTVRLIKKEAVTLFRKDTKIQFEELNSKILDLEESNQPDEFEDQD